MPETPPNIVLILVDDADPKVLNHIASSRIRSKILEFEEDGAHAATATRYLTTQPLCSPSRASILRGMYPHNTGVDGNTGAYDAFIDGDGVTGGEASNIARWLKAAPTPYRTGMLGKYINGYEPEEHLKPDAGWDVWFGVGHAAYNGYNYWSWDDYNPDGPPGAKEIRH